MNHVKPKKSLGQHFLKDLNIAKKITDTLVLHKNYQKVLEIGAGTGVLTQFLVKNPNFQTFVVDIDKQSIAYLNEKKILEADRIIEADFLKMNLRNLFENEPFGIIGNFPYNISSQIFFKVLNNRDLVPEIVCMIQKEVAQRIASKHGSKEYGILSVLMQAFYDVKYHFSVEPHVFNPPPKVKSAVISFKRNTTENLPCSEKLFFSTVKSAFNQRRKTLRNTLKHLSLPKSLTEKEIFGKRAEQLSVQEFIDLVVNIEKALKTE